MVWEKASSKELSSRELFPTSPPQRGKPTEHRASPDETTTTNQKPCRGAPTPLKASPSLPLKIPIIAKRLFKRHTPDRRKENVRSHQRSIPLGHKEIHESRGSARLRNSRMEKLSGAARRKAAWELVEDYWVKKKGKHPDELRLQRVVTRIQRPKR